jgi:hypothetical protein
MELVEKLESKDPRLDIVVFQAALDQCLQLALFSGTIVSLFPTPPGLQAGSFMSARRIPHGITTCRCSLVLPFTLRSSGTFACTQSRISVSVLRFIPNLQTICSKHANTTTVLSETEGSLKIYKYPSKSSQVPFFFSSSSHSLILLSLSNLLYNLLLDANTNLSLNQHVSL